VSLASKGEVVFSVVEVFSTPALLAVHLASGGDEIELSSTLSSINMCLSLEGDEIENFISLDDEIMFGELVVSDVALHV